MDTERRTWHCEVFNADCLDQLTQIPENSYDALVTDPPAGISFMGKTWDSDKGGREEWVSNMAKIFRLTWYALKPGAHALVWALPRTSHWTATALEDAGFEIRDVVLHLFGSGFPKSLDVGKAIDKIAGAERKIIGISSITGARRGSVIDDKAGYTPGRSFQNSESVTNHITVPATDDAKKWDGWGTSLKPGSEHWILARKPISESTVAANAVKWGTGGINIDGGRISTEERPLRERRNDPGMDGPTYGHGINGSKAIGTTTKGRWPANVTLAHTKSCHLVATHDGKGYAINRFTDGAKPFGGGAGHPFESEQIPEKIEIWACVPGCPVRMLDDQSGTLTSGYMAKDTNRTTDGGYHGGFPTDRIGAHDTYGDAGGASRFFYVAKPSRAERNEGLEDMAEKPLNWSSGTKNPGSFQAEGTKKEVQNFHPTVKGISLMRYLCRLITPPGGIVLDPFMGSGTTALACYVEKFGFVGIEKEAEYFEIAKARIAEATRQQELF